MQSCEENLTTSDPNGLAASTTSTTLNSSSSTDQKVIVTDCNLQGWAKQIAGGALGDVAFVTEPSKPSNGNGSLEFYVPDMQRIRLYYNGFLGRYLNEISEISISTYIQERTVDRNTIYVVLQLDVNKDGIVDFPIVFDPYYQTTPWVKNKDLDQGPSVLGKWQTWDLYNGLWFQGPTLDPEHGQPLYSLKDWAKIYPAAVFEVNGGGKGALRITAGGEEAYFGINFIGFADKLNLKIGKQEISFDFGKCQL